MHFIDFFVMMTSREKKKIGFSFSCSVKKRFGTGT